MLEFRPSDPWYNIIRADEGQGGAGSGGEAERRGGGEGEAFVLKFYQGSWVQTLDLTHGEPLI